MTGAASGPDAASGTGATAGTDATAGLGVTAVVPLRDGVSGKSRLAAVLDAGSRRRLVRVLARHVVTTLLDTDGIGRVVVVTADPVFARETLAGLDVDVLEQRADRPGLNGALEHARETLAAAPLPGRLLVAHADLPALTPADVTALLAEPVPVVIATDRNRSGTNLLLVPAAVGLPNLRLSNLRLSKARLPNTRLPNETAAASLSAPAKRSSHGLVGEGEREGEREGELGREREAELQRGRSLFRFRFGAGSLVAHLVEAAAHGLEASVVHRPGTAVDLDTADDWSQLPDDVRAVVGQQVPGLM